jgi:hypothetical protein
MGVAAFKWQLGIALCAGVARLDQGHAGLCRLAELVQHAPGAVVQLAPFIEVAAQHAGDFLGCAAELAKAVVRL